MKRAAAGEDAGCRGRRQHVKLPLKVSRRNKFVGGVTQCSVERPVKRADKRERVALALLPGADTLGHQR